ncbi:MAG: FAD-dependent oxidoreductase [Leucobacter sp.]
MAQTWPEYWWIKNLFDPPPRPTGFLSTEDDEFDVIIVGAGTAGLVSAALAHDAGASVLVLEASDEVGGTTFKSGGGIWIPDNALMRSKGVRDDREACLRYIMQVAHRFQYDADDARFGADDWQWETINAFYDHGAPALEALAAADVLHVTQSLSWTERYPAVVTYHPDLDQTIQGFYRHLHPLRPDGEAGSGAELVTQLTDAIKRRGIPLLTDHRVQGLIRDSSGAAVGVTVGDRRFFARQGIVFGSGGFAHGLDLLEEYWDGPLWSSCAVGTAQGDFVRIGRDAGAELAHMGNGWLYEDLLEKAAQNRVNEDKGIPVPPGDSMIYVDLHGERVVNEKLIYQDRNRIFWEKDETGEFPNRVLMMIFDEAVATDTKPTFYFDTFQAPKPWIIEGATLEELQANIESRLADLADLTGGFRLAPDFAERLPQTIARFDEFAREGVDEDFHRGETMTEFDWHGLPREGNDKNPTMHPFRDSGPYYCVLVCGMVLDTNGGPKTNGRSQVLRPDGSAIPGLYGAGNCVASICGDGYLSLGSTLGPAIAFAYLAAQNVVQEPVRDLTEVRAAR